MRLLFPARRRYQCASCGRSLFVPLHSVLARAEPAHGVLQKRRHIANVAVGWTATASVLVIAGWVLWLQMPAQRLHFAEPGRPLASAGLTPAPGRATGCHHTHIFQAGETLEAIAANEMGAEWHAQDIWVLNQPLLDRLRVEDKGLEPGQAIEVPAPCN
ncbi:hypothetical protein HHL11_18670 [Ramlibacter sp. G-1-2-2]|uniref:LysM domain-containing protein n=1 Tax=Ramlibacter agri TaxID=2728837 RepID=A0A848HDY7_9BURK|nr:hypothetical protein [Ramlibacter agri]